MNIRPPCRLGLVSVALALLPPMLAGSALADDAGRPNPTPPAGGIGETAPGAMPQDAADLRRTRDLVFGFALSDAQHYHIESWRVADPAWWLDATRNQSARDAMLALMDRLQGPDANALQQSLDADPNLFGVEVEEIVVAQDPDGSPASRETALRMTIDARLRPDLVSLHEAVLDLSAHAVHTVAAQGEEARRIFLKFLLSHHDESPTNEPIDSMLYDPDRYFVPTARLLDELEIALKNQVHAWYDAELEVHLADDGATFDVATHRWLDREARRLESEVSHQAVASYLEQLDPDLRDAVTSYLVDEDLPRRLTILQGESLEREAAMIATARAILEHVEGN
ncbi:MAG: hypothetical protein AAGC60_08315 [Acidobacteriota bacterium]